MNRRFTIRAEGAMHSLAALVVLVIGAVVAVGPSVWLIVVWNWWEGGATFHAPALAIFYSLWSTGALLFIAFKRRGARRMTEAPPSAGQTKGARPVTVGMVFVPYEVQRSRRAAELLAPFIANPGVNVLPTFALYPLVAFLPLPGGSRGWLLALGLPVLSICAEDEIRALLVHSWARFVRPGIPAGLWLAKLGAQIRRRMDSARIDEIAPLIYLTLDRFGDVADHCTALNASYAEEEAGRSTSKETFARARRALELAVRYWNPFVQQKLAPALRYGMLPPVANGFREYLSHVAPDVYSKVAPNPVALALENLWPTERKLCSAIIGEAANELRMCHWEDLPAEVLVSHWTSEGLKGFWAF